MLCVNPANGYLVIKDFAPDGTCAFTALMTAQDANQMADLISNTDTAFIIAAVCGLYGSVFVIKLVLQLLGYRN